MPEDPIDHEEARRDAALRQPNNRLSAPYLDLSEKLESAHRALGEIVEIAAEPGEAGAMAALKDAQRIAANALPDDGKVVPLRRPGP